MRLGEFETQVYEQMVTEFPEMEETHEHAVYIDNHTGRTFKGVEAVVYFVCNKMWDAFDEALVYVTKGDDDGED